MFHQCGQGLKMGRQPENLPYGPIQGKLVGAGQPLQVPGVISDDHGHELLIQVRNEPGVIRAACLGEKIEAAFPRAVETHDAGIGAECMGNGFGTRVDVYGPVKAAVLGPVDTRAGTQERFAAAYRAHTNQKAASAGERREIIR